MDFHNHAVTTCIWPQREGHLNRREHTEVHRAFALPCRSLASASPALLRLRLRLAAPACRHPAARPARAPPPARCPASPLARAPPPAPPLRYAPRPLYASLPVSGRCTRKCGRRVPEQFPGHSLIAQICTLQSQVLICIAALTCRRLPARSPACLARRPARPHRRPAAPSLLSQVGSSTCHCAQAEPKSHDITAGAAWCICAGRCRVQRGQWQGQSCCC